MMKTSTFLVAAALFVCAVEAQVLAGRGAYNITFYTGSETSCPANTTVLTLANSTAASVAYNCNASAYVNFVTQFQTYTCSDAACTNCSAASFNAQNTSYRTDDAAFTGATVQQCNVTQTNQSYYYVEYYAQRCCGSDAGVCLTTGDIMFSSANRTSQCISVPVGGVFTAVSVLQTFANPNANYTTVQTTGVQTTGVQTTGVQTTGVQTTGVILTTGIQTTGVQTTGVQTTGIQTTRVQTTGSNTGAGVREVASVMSLVALAVFAIAF